MDMGLIREDGRGATSAEAAPRYTNSDVDHPFPCHSVDSAAPNRPNTKHSVAIAIRSIWLNNPRSNTESHDDLIPAPDRD